MRITVYNDFHQTEAHLNVNPETMHISASQMVRARRKLCPSRRMGCECGDDMGMRGSQSVLFIPTYNSAWECTGADVEILVSFLRKQLA